MNTSKCPSCLDEYNQADKLPKVLSCSDLVCLKCLKETSKTFINESIYNCLKCNKESIITNFSAMPTNNALFYCFKKGKISSPKKTLKFNQRLEKYEINKHYDNIINSIDIRTESLISYVCSVRDQFMNQINEQRKRSISEIDYIENSEISKTINNDLDQFSNDKNKNIDDLISNISKLEQMKCELKKKLWYFDENVIKHDNSILGFILNKNLDRNYIKIKNLHSTFNKNGENLDPSNLNTIRIHFESPNNYGEMSIRQHVLPLSRNRIIKVYFTTKRSLIVESFDSNGKFLKCVTIFENLSSFPFVYSYGNYFCLTFSAKSKTNASFFDSNQNYVLLYDSDLECLKTVKKFASIESIFMNEKNVFLFYSHKSIGCCEILDYDFNEIESIGQQTEPQNEFYMEKTDLPWKEQNASGLKNNPRIFGFNDEEIHFFNRNQMVIMNRKTGIVKKTVESNGDPAYFFLDSEGNIIKVNSLCKRISLFNYEHDITVTNRFSDCFEDVYLTIDNYLVFVDKNKDFVNFV